MQPANRTDHLLRKGLKLSHLRLLAALTETEQLTTAAAAIGVSQPAASRLVAEIEQIIGAPVHERSGRGIGLTAMGRALSLRAQRVRLELDDAARDLAEIAAGGEGHVRVGTVTGAALDRVLPALHHERMLNPKVTVEVIVAASDALCEQLLAGQLDFALGRMSAGQPSQMLSYSTLESEPMALIARRGHPLLNSAAKLTGKVLVGYDWVMPGRDSLLTQAVLARLNVLGLPMPRQQVATTSFLLTLALLRQSDTIGVVSRSTALQFASGSDAGFALIPLDLGIVVEPYGMISREKVALTPAAQRLADMIRAAMPLV